ncbi:MAG: hypothetical protein EXS37_12190 [Opitutus sp.]|nr:hypothetical protein [Opitutus sp.]
MKFLLSILPAFFLAGCGSPADQPTAAPAPTPVTAAARPDPASSFRAGAAALDITPLTFPVRVNGGFLEKSVDKVVDRLHARAVVIENATTRIALCVVDTCMMPRELLDAAKAAASKATGIATDRMLISATHTHSAPAAMACLGSRLDEKYAAFLQEKIAEAIVAAAGRVQPARVGWASIDAWELTNCRRWIRRPDRLLTDPFGVVSVRANMHPGYESPDVTGPSGPIDPELSLLSIQTRAGQPLALLANFSMHYFGAPPLSADHCGRFAAGIGKLIGASEAGGFVGILSQGTSGDSHWMDYSQPANKPTLDQYSEALLQKAVTAYHGIKYDDAGPLVMAETRLMLRRRVADPARLAWAKTIANPIGDRAAANQREVYALEQLMLAAEPERELKLQALRIGELGITAIPDEVYAITGLKLKAQSPLRATFNVELANGSEGYIPPPEQHFLGGYTTWAARTAGLEEQAEPRIVETVLGLLEKVSGAKRRPLSESHGTYATAVLAAKPHAYWRLNEINPPIAADASGNGRTARYENGVALHLPGAQSATDGISAVPERPSTFSGDQINRAPHFAGGRVRADLPKLGRTYSAELWLWNSLPGDARPVTGNLFSRGREGDASAGEHLGLSGTAQLGRTGRLFFSNGDARREPLLGRTALGFRTWHHVVLVRDGGNVRVHIDGNASPDLEGTADWTLTEGVASAFVGGRCDNAANFEGRIDEVAVYDRALPPAEIAAHFKVSGRIAPVRVAAAVPSAVSSPPTSPEESPKAVLVPNVDAPPLSPVESLGKVHVPPGFKAELVAAEPLVLDPVAFDWDERGRLWVVEMADYPLGMDGRGKPGGRVRVLEDTDGDGRYDKSTVFADGLNYPNGILTWRDGVIVTAAPHIFFLRDTDGDGKADVREILVDGLFEGNQQLRANGLRWGLDNWVYVASGGHVRTHGAATRLRSTRTGKEVATGSRDFRLRPDTGELEPQSGPTQFGRNRDNWGRWFGTQNSNPLWHYVLPDHYLGRNPHFGADQTLVQLLAPANPPVYPASPLEKRFHSFDQAGRFTSACSAVIYRDRQLFPAEETHAFVCEPFHNLVQHVRLTDAGVSFAASRVSDEGKFDFFASEDRWCRPVMVREGPDGALWIADMYRYMIEHPQWLPPQGKDELLPHYRIGDDRGRLYRVSRTGMPAFKPVRFDPLGIAALVAALDSSNGWQRDKVHQLLLWRADGAAPALLRELASRSANPLARLHALCVLDGLGELTPAEVGRALSDPHPGVRENALRLAEPRFTPEILAAAVRLADDADAKVRLQLAFSLGAAPDAPAGETLGRLLTASTSDPMLVAAVMSSAAPHSRALVAAAVRAGGETLTRLATPLLPLALGLNDREALVRLLTPAFAADGNRFSAEQLAGFSRLLDLLAERSSSLEKLRSASPSDALARLLEKAAGLVAQTRATATDTRAPAAERIAAASLLGRDPASRAEALPLLTAWLDPKHATDAQAAAIRALTATGAPEVPALLARAWPALGPATRQAALAAWMSREPWTFDLVQRLERNEFPAAFLDPTQRTRLLKHEAKRIQLLAAKVFASTATAARGAVIERYRPALALNGDPAKGREIFLLACAVCHKRGADGRDVGPDLASVVQHPPEKLLASILDPSADIQPGFTAYTCTLTNGEQVYGLLSAETANSVTMKLVDGTRKTVLRNQIGTLQSQNLSLMPDGLEGTIAPQGMADLIAFLRGPLAPEKR